VVEHLREYIWGYTRLKQFNSRKRTQNMIQRVFISHYRLFENFEINLSDRKTVLLIGKNGVGKSTLGKALRILQDIGRGSNRLKTLFSEDDYGSADTNRPIRIEIEVKIGDKRFEYSLAVELPEKFTESRVLEESLAINGQNVYRREQAEVTLANSANAFLVDWHLVALPVVQVRGIANPIAIFKEWLSRMVIISPTPSLMNGLSQEDSLELTHDCENFASWFGGVLSEYPASYSVIAEYLKEVLPDFQDFQNKPISDVAKQLFVRFAGDQVRPLRLDFKNLSDGEKCFFVCSIVLAANRFYGPIFCLWDEPDNYLSLSEVGHMTMALRRSFEKSGQLIVSSHNPEAIRKFSDDNTLCLSRASHRESPTAKWLSDIGYQGDLVESLVRGDIHYGGQ
jgi:predicted ATPase